MVTLDDLAVIQHFRWRQRLAAGTVAKRVGRRRRWVVTALVGVAWGWADLAGAPVADAEELYNDGDVTIRWDNTIRYSAAFRLAGRDPNLLANPNGDDGDRNFAPGLISNRIDLLSQLEVAQDGFGFNASAAGWYDTVYNQRNDNNSPATFNPDSVLHNQFTRATRDLEGQAGKLGAAVDDGFVYGSTELASLPFTFRLGRQTLLWGESLFFADNGIAAGQSPIDDAKGLIQPGSYTRDSFLPIAQVSASLQLRDNMSIEAYYQLEWRPTRLPGSGSYFSTDDYIGAGGERYIVGPGQYLYHGFDRPAPASGQYGFALRFSAGDVDYGLYALRFNAKDPEVYYRPDAAEYEYDREYSVPSRTYVPDGKVGTYYSVYPRGIELYGASASITLGDSTIAAEISGRRNAPLPSAPLYVRSGSAAGTGRNPLYPIGDTLNADLSSVTNFARNRAWDSAALSVDVAANLRLDISRNAYNLEPDAKRLAGAFRVSFEPTYFEVLPHLDLTFRVGAGYDFIGDLSPDPYRSESEGAGQLDFGVTATYRVVWSGGISVTHFLGSATNQPLADRDFLSLSVQRTF